MKSLCCLVSIFCILAVLACGDSASPEPVVVPGATVIADKSTPETAKLSATSTPEPTSTPAPTGTPVPSPTETPVPAPTAAASPESYYDLGKENLANRDIGSALSNLSKAIELKPDFGDAYYLRGLAHALGEKYDEAIADFDKVIELDPNHSDVEVALGGTLVGRGAEQALRGDYDEAINDFERAIELGADSEDAQSGLLLAFLKRGLDYFEEGDENEAIADFDRAIEGFERIIAEAPGDAESRTIAAGAYLFRAIISYDKGYFSEEFAYFDRAFADLERAIELDPDSIEARVAVADAYLWRGFTHYDLYDSDAAIADFTRSIESSEEVIGLYPDSIDAKVAAADAHLWRGIVHSERSEHDDALADFDRVLEIAPDSDETEWVRWDAQNEIAKIEVELGEGIAWSACDYGLKCGFVEVPADYRDPGGGGISIAVSVRRADYQDERIGYLFVNPGGPGVSGLELVQASDYAFDDEVLERFDIIGFDPRGVGSSEPEFACGAPGEQIALLATVQGAIDTPEEIAAGEAAANLCIESMGTVGGLLHSEYVARDMNEIRKALGAEQVSYLGFSYGSELGVWYATLFPESVRAMVVDGADNPVDRSDTQDMRMAEYLEETLALEVQLREALTACDNPECPIYNGGDPIGYYYLASEKLYLVNRAAGGVPYAAYMSVVTPLYDEEDWPLLWWGLYELYEDDDTEILLEFVNRQLDDEPTAANFTAHVNCLDGFALKPHLDRATRLDDRAVFGAISEERLPLQEAADFDSASACPFYDQFAPDPLEVPLDGGGVPILVIGNRSDPVTSFAESEEFVTETLSNGYLVETSHFRHGVYPDNECVNEHVHRALIEAVYPDGSAFCDRED